MGLEPLSYRPSNYRHKTRGRENQREGDYRTRNQRHKKDMVVNRDPMILVMEQFRELF